MEHKILSIFGKPVAVLPSASIRTLKLFLFASLVLTLVTIAQDVLAHHVLGRPAYSLNEDSNTPSSMQIETQIGDYFVNFAVFPAFPRPGERGRINLYVSNIKTNQPPQTNIEFRIRDDSWFSTNEEHLGTQVIDDGIYRQGFIFSQRGAYIISAVFHDGVAPYTIDFPIHIGKPPVIGPLGISIAAIAIILIAVNLIQRKRLRLRKHRNKQVSAE